MTFQGQMTFQGHVTMATTLMSHALMLHANRYANRHANRYALRHARGMPAACPGMPYGRLFLIKGGQKVEKSNKVQNHKITATRE